MRHRAQPGALAKEVANAVSFNDLSYFSWVYKCQLDVGSCAHLNFRISAQVRPATPSSALQFIVSTVVQCNNFLGRTYITVIAPFHRAIFQAALRRGAK